jgi:DNA polymerase III epsilon subunit family exonuclease
MAEEFIAIDFETTGLDPREDKIVEIGAVRFSEKGEILDTFEMLANPGRSIPKEAQEKNGITNNMVREKLPPAEVWKRFLEWAGTKYTALVAHNAAKFEIHFVRALYSNRQDIPKLVFLDTYLLSKARLKNERSFRLDALVPKQRGESRHRALPDAKACVKLFMKNAATYQSGKIPRCHMRAIESFGEFVPRDAPSKRQLKYIEDLGGDHSKVSSRSEASTYIDYLKGKSGQDPTRKTHFPIAVAYLMLVVLILWALLA